MFSLDDAIMVIVLPKRNEEMTLSLEYAVPNLNHVDYI